MTIDLTGSSTNATIMDSQAMVSISDDDAEPDISIGDVTVKEGNGVIAAVATFTINLSEASGRDVSVDYVTNDPLVMEGFATAGADYVSSGGSVTISAGITSADFSVLIMHDTMDEHDEQLLVTLAGATNAVLMDTEVVAIIIDNDAAPELSIVDEGNGYVEFTVRLSAASEKDITVDYATAAGTAAGAGEDFWDDSYELTFYAGETTQSIWVSINDDSLDEFDETMYVDLSAPSNATIADNQGEVTITDNDAPPTISIDDQWNSENETGTFNVSLSAASAKDITVAYATSDGDAVAGDDYTSAGGTLTFLAGDTDKTVSVSLIDDALDEPDENYYVDLSAPSNATLGDSQGEGWIYDTDDPPEITVSDITVDESAGTAVFTLTLSAASGFDVSVDYDTSDGLAMQGGDYTYVTSTVTIPAGSTSETVSVPVTDDAVDEYDEDFYLNLWNEQNATLVNCYALAIVDNDAPPALSINDVTVSEGVMSGYAEFTVSLSAPSEKEVTVDFETADGTAETLANDYTDSIGTVTFARSDPFTTDDTTQTVSVFISDDSLDEYDETFFVNLSGAENATISDAQGQATITDDDAPPTISIDDQWMFEGDTAVFKVSLSEESAKPVTVAFATSDDDAVAGEDYTAASGTLNFSAGADEETVEVELLTDSLEEFDEYFYVNLTAPTNATFGDSQGEGRIEDSAVCSCDCVEPPSFPDPAAEVESPSTSEAFTAFLMTPTTVTDIEIEKTGGNMNYPDTIYVGDTVTFTAVLDPEDGTPDSIEWRLMEFEQETDAGGIPSTSWTEQNGTGESWSAQVNLATKAIIAGSGAWTEIRVKVTCDGTVSNDDEEFEVKPYVVTGIDEVGGTDEGDTRTYKATIDPPLGTPVGTISWERERTDTWGSSDDTSFGSSGIEVTKAEVDPGVWKIDISMSSGSGNTGGYTSTATLNVTIDPAKVSGITYVETLCNTEGAMSVEYTVQSSTGRTADLDHTHIWEHVTYYKNDGTAPDPFVADEPFEYPANFKNPKIKDFGVMPSPYDKFYDIHGPAPRSAAAVANGTTGQLKATQKYFATYDDAQDPTNEDYFSGGGPFDIMRYIELHNGVLRYRVTKHGECTGPPTEPLQ